MNLLININVVNPPTNLKALRRTTTSILLSWTNSTSTVDGYRIYRALNRNGPYRLIKIVNNNEYLDTGLSESTTYYYKVEAYLDNVNAQIVGPVLASTYDYNTCNCYYCNLNNNQNNNNNWFNWFII